jgi:hypothetical protein
LILFDRIVIPIPESPFGALNNQELDKLNKDAEKLVKSNAAVIYKWSPDKFQEWEKETIREALMIKKSDKQYHTRLQLLTQVDDLKPNDVEYISAVPVYGARKEFEEAYSKITLGAPDNLTIELSQLISVPEVIGDYFPLDEIIELRTEESFQSARRALRDWQIKKMPEVIGENSEKQIRLGKEEFEQMLLRYEEEIKKGKFGKTKIIVTSLLALGALFSAAMGQVPAAIALMSGAAPHLFSLKESLTPAWKDIRDKKFEAAGVIYEANRMLNQ